MKNNILKILKDLRPEFDFSERSDFFEEGLLDSFDLISFVSELEGFYKVSIKGTDIVPENFKNLESIELLLRKHGAVDES